MLPMLTGVRGVGGWLPEPSLLRGGDEDFLLVTMGMWEGRAVAMGDGWSGWSGCG